MGIAASWIAVRGYDKAELLRRFRMQEGDPPDEFLDALYALAEMPSGWLLVLARGTKFATPSVASKVSRGGEALACMMDENVMFSGARLYRDGAEIWGVVHDANDGVNDIRLSRLPPPQFKAVHKIAVERQAEADAKHVEVDHLFDVPLNLSVAICGFRPDLADDLPEPAFRELELVRMAPDPARPSKGLMALFGGRRQPKA